MEHRLAILFGLFTLLAAASTLTLAPPIFGLSTILGVSVLGSSVLGSSVLGSSVLGSSVLGSSVLGTTIVEAYGNAIAASQVHLILSVIGLLACLEITQPSYGSLRSSIAELRKSWLPVSALLVFLFFIIVALRVHGVLVG